MKAYARALAVFMAALLVILAWMRVAPSENGVARAGSDVGNVPRSEEEERMIRVYKQANEAVVFITTITLTIAPFDVFFEMAPKEGTGSGIIVDAVRGIILTNLHVIQDAHQIEITLSDGQPYRARLVGYDNEFDIAVLQLQDPPTHLVSLPFGDSGKLEVGQRVLAIGNPFSLNRSLTTGIVSSLDRTVKNPSGQTMRGLIQTDAAINPGNSGGPLLDMAGRLIGINSAILSQSGDSAGIGFAVPINQVKRVLPELIATGKVLRPKLGWILVDTNQGVMVRHVIPGSPAARAGVQPIERKVENVFLHTYVRDFSRGDLVSKVNGRPVYSRDEIDEILAKSDPSQTVRLSLRRGGRNGQEREISVKPELQ